MSWLLSITPQYLICAPTASAGRRARQARDYNELLIGGAPAAQCSPPGHAVAGASADAGTTGANLAVGEELACLRAPPGGDAITHTIVLQSFFHMAALARDLLIQARIQIS
jgi:hypothetical protein